MFLRSLRKASSAQPHTPAAFDDEPETLARLDWRLFQSGAVVLYHRQQVLAEDAAWLVRAGYRLHELDAARWKDVRAFHEDAKRVFGFGDHYAHNLASLVDALAELQIEPGGAMLVQIKRYDLFAAVEPHLAQSVLDALDTTSRRLLLTGRRLLTQVQSNDARIRFERVGAMPVNWNPREWLDSDRGIGGGSSAQR
jgi:hypothetical protein